MVEFNGDESDGIESVQTSSNKNIPHHSPLVIPKKGWFFQGWNVALTGFCKPNDHDQMTFSAF